MFPSPSVDGKIMSGFFKLTGAGNFGMGMLCDDDPLKISQFALETYMGHLPAGTSFRCIEHYRQLLVNKKFQKFDFGLEKNLDLYDNETPTEINLQSFSGVPIALFCGVCDKLASPLDYGWLRD